MRWALVCAALLALPACSEPDPGLPEEEVPEWLTEDELVEPDDEDRPPIEHPGELTELVGLIGVIGIAEVVDARRTPRWPLALDESWTLELGRGSGRTGLDVASVEASGEVSVTTWSGERRQHVVRRTTIAPEVLREALETLAPTELKHRFREPGVMDGTQWVLQVHQGERVHTVYCDNRLPRRLREFADWLDEALEAAEVETRDVGVLREQDHPEHALWQGVYALEGKPIS